MSRLLGVFQLFLITGCWPILIGMYGNGVVKAPEQTLEYIIGIQLMAWLLKLALSEPLRIPKYLVSLAILTVSVHFFVILFGAPFLSQIGLTFRFSAYLSLIMFSPLLSSLPATLETMADFKKQLHRTLVLNYADSWNGLQVWACWIGAGIGVVVIPLDWDRPWQRYPIPLVITSFAGYVLVSVSMLIMGDIRSVKKGIASETPETVRRSPRSRRAKRD